MAMDWCEKKSCLDQSILTLLIRSSFIYIILYPFSSYLQSMWVCFQYWRSPMTPLKGALGNYVLLRPCYGWYNIRLRIQEMALPIHRSAKMGRVGLGRMIRWWKTWRPSSPTRPSQPVDFSLFFFWHFSEGHHDDLDLLYDVSLIYQRHLQSPRKIPLHSRGWKTLNTGIRRNSSDVTLTYKYTFGPISKSLKEIEVVTKRERLPQRGARRARKGCCCHAMVTERWASSIGGRSGAVRCQTRLHLWGRRWQRRLRYWTMKCNPDMIKSTER